MRRDDVIAKLKETEPVLRGFGVAALYLFGSHVRDEAGPDSDIDVFVDVAPGAAFGLRQGPFYNFERGLVAQIGVGLGDLVGSHVDGVKVDCRRRQGHCFLGWRVCSFSNRSDKLF